MKSRTLNLPHDGVRVFLPLMIVLALASCTIDMFNQAAFGQNVEGQIIASQYGQWQLQGTQTNSFVFSPAACQVKGGNKNFSALKQGVPISIIDPGNSALDETVVAGLVNIQACSVQLRPANVHNPPFYLTSGTAGLQEAINANQTASGTNSIILSANWYKQGGSAKIIASVTGIPTLSLVDITTSPYTWYQWNGSQYNAVPVGGGGSPGGTIGAFQYNSGGLFSGSVITGLVKGNGANAPSAAVPGTDYQAPLGYTPANVTNNLSDLTSAPAARSNLGLGTSTQLAGILNNSPSTQLSAALVPTLNQNTTGNAATATALASKPTQCSGSQFATGIGPNGNAICAAMAGGVPSVNGVTSAITMAASGTGLSVSTIGNVVTYSLSGGAGVGSVGSAAQYACGQYPVTGTTIGGAANCYILPAGMTANQINAVLSSLTGASTVYLQGNGQTFSNPNNVHIVDLSVSSPQNARSLKEWGAQCDTRQVSGTLSGNTLAVYDDSASQSDVGKTLVAVGTVGGIPTAFEPTITAVSANSETLSYSAPFAISSEQQLTLGHDDTAAIASAIAAQQASGLSNNISLVVPVGKCLTHAQSASAQDMAGYSMMLSGFISYPGESVFTVAGGSLQHFSNFFVKLDNRIDPTKPWQLISANGTTTSEAAVYQPIMVKTAESNNPLGPGWFLGGFNGVATVTNGSPTITITSASIPSAGQQIVFPYLSTIFTTTVSAVTGTTVTLAASYPGATGTLQEWFAGSSVQALAAAVAAPGSRTYPLTVTLTNSIAPTPGFETNFAGHGVIKIDSEECSYIGYTQSSPYSITIPAPTDCGLNGTTAAAHDSGATVVPLNPFLFDAAPWPVIPTITSGSTTPPNASFYPAFNVGQFAFGAPWSNGAVGLVAGPYQATFDHLAVSEWPANNEVSFGPVNDASFYWVGLPYADHFDNLELGNQYCFVEGVTSINSHQCFNAGPTSDGMTISNVACHASTYGMVADIIAGGEISVRDWNTYGGGAGGGPDSGAGFNITGGWDDETGGEGQSVSAAEFANIYLEPGWYSFDNGSGMELDCNTCEMSDFHYVGPAVINVGGAAQHFKGGGVATGGGAPLINWGDGNSFDGMLDVNEGPQGTAYGSADFLNWGYNLSGCVAIDSQPNSPCINPGIGNTLRHSNGQSSETFATGNITAPYVDPITSFVTAAEFSYNSSTDAYPMSSGTYWDITAPITGSYGICNIQGGTGCLFDHFGGQESLIGIGPGQRIVAGSYIPTIAFKGSVAGTFVLTMQAAYCVGNPTIYSSTIAATTSWQTLQLPIANFAPFSGCDLSLGFLSAGNNINVDVAFVDFTPLAQNIQAQQFTLPSGSTWTSGSSAPSGQCMSGSLYTNTNGTPNTLYVCQSGSWVGK